MYFEIYHLTNSMRYKCIYMLCAHTCVQILTDEFTHTLAYKIFSHSFNFHHLQKDSPESIIAFSPEKSSKSLAFYCCVAQLYKVFANLQSLQ